ncbi:ABC transporter ATP-binding protein [Nocardioides bigeumensis]|uniref:ABC transporter ATP-binding protein n=1 Tax=Nocardioides bigeumensis TaxID=433657 RepID=A0ABP5JYI0_9ACTN
MTATSGSLVSEEKQGAGLVVQDLGVMLTGKPVDVVDDIDLVLKPGEVVGLVGESGSGKTTVGTSLLGYSRAGAFISSGKVLLEERDVLTMHWREMRQVRGEEIAYVPQDPASALNPSIRIGRQIVELLELRGIGTKESRLQGARDGLEEVGLPSDDEFLSRYAHQLSGGQVQRVALAMAFLPKPKVLVLDEPTTGLDVTTQAMVLKTMAALCKSHGVSALYVTHDLAVVANIADRVAVMYAGQIVELGPRDALFRNPSHPYTRALLDSIPHLSQARALTGIPGRTPAPGARPSGCRFNDRCSFAIDECRSGVPELRTIAPEHDVRCIRAEQIGTWDISRGAVPDADPDKKREVILSVEGLNVFYGRKHVVHDVSFDLAKAEVVALVGESGSGKTTISRSIGGLHKDWTGVINFEGDELAKGARQRSALNRKRLQYIFQNPYLSLNPRLTIEQIVKRPMELFGIASGKEATDRAVDLLDQVALGPRMLRYQASRLSGGERQRVAIARALAAEPDVMICDEITSALDVSVQGSIVELLEGLRLSRGISMVFVTHNLALVRSIAARVEILQAGRVVEAGPVVEVMDHPKQEYTRNLLANSPRID